jgi:hypothetical protein
MAEVNAVKGLARRCQRAAYARPRSHFLAPPLAVPPPCLARANTTAGLPILAVFIVTLLGEEWRRLHGGE